MTLPCDERQLLIVGRVKWNVASNAVLQPCLDAFQRQRMVVDGKLVDEELMSQYEVWEITHTKHTNTSPPHSMTLDFWIPLGIDC